MSARLRHTAKGKEHQPDARTNVPHTASPRRPSDPAVQDDWQSVVIVSGPELQAIETYLGADITKLLKMGT